MIQNMVPVLSDSVTSLLQVKKLPGFYSILEEDITQLSVDRSPKNNF